MNSKFSPKSILDEFYHFYQSEKRVLIFIPLLISFVLTFIVKIDMSLINLLLVSLSIFLGFLLNLMMMSFNLKDDTIPPIEVGGRLWHLKDVLEEYHITISFEILVTIMLVILMLFASLVHKNIYILFPTVANLLKLIYSFVIMYLLILFLIVLFRVLNFGHILLKYFIKN